MKIGLMARADNTGLGVQTHDFYKHMKPDKTMVVDISVLNGNKQFLERYPDADIVTEGFPNRQEIDEFLRGLDILFTCETPYNYYVFQKARDMGVKTVLQYNWEFLDYLQRHNLPHPDLFAAPSLWHFDELPFDNKAYLPVPVDTDKFEFVQRDYAKSFLHIAGIPAVNDRNGTETVIAALEHIKSDAEIIIRSQDESFINDYIKPATQKYKQVKLHSEDLEDNAQVYDEGDVMLMPRRYGGLCLPMNEAIAKGMPVIMTDIEPNNRILQEDWLIPAEKTGEFMTRTMIDIYSGDPKKLAERIDWFVEMGSMFAFHNRAAQSMREGMSWENLSKRYMREFEKLCSR